MLAKPLLDLKAKEGSKPGTFHVAVPIFKPFSCLCYETTTGGCWLLLELPLVHKGVAEKSLLIQRLNMKAKVPCWLHREIFTLVGDCSVVIDLLPLTDGFT